ncbi:MAG: hypothetical protein FWC95_01615 [Defluviitaleaceae bacterium]|nr:hypothetical protein [Defluviitaleaceae bacterium]
MKKRVLAGIALVITLVMLVGCSRGIVGTWEFYRDQDQTRAEALEELEGTTMTFIFNRGGSGSFEMSFMGIDISVDLDWSEDGEYLTVEMEDGTVETSRIRIDGRFLYMYEGDFYSVFRRR